MASRIGPRNWGGAYGAALNSGYRATQTWSKRTFLQCEYGGGGKGCTVKMRLWAPMTIEARYMFPLTGNIEPCSAAEVSL